MTDQGNPNPPAPETPEAPTTPPAPAATKTPIAPLALTALIVGGAAFLFGLVPFFGLLLAIGGVVIAIIALVKKSKPTWMPAVGLAAAGVALITSIIVVASFAAGLANLSSNVGNLPQGPVAEEPAETEEPAEPELPLAQQQAVDKAQQYISLTAFSRSGLIDQLKFEGFEEADATFAVDYLDIDWNEQAAIKAQDYLDLTSFSKQSLTEQLEFDGFTSDEAAYGVKAVGF